MYQPNANNAIKNKCNNTIIYKLTNEEIALCGKTIFKYFTRPVK